MLRLGRFEAAFEIYGPNPALRTSEVLTDFNIILEERVAYSGRAVLRNIVDTGTAVVCEASLDETSWLDVDFTSDAIAAAPARLAGGFTSFIQEWGKLYRVTPDYKIIIADMQSFFAQLRLWLEQVEIGIRSSPSGDRLMLEQRLASELTEPVVASMNALFEKFENVANTVPAEVEPVHRSYMRQQLHPWIMSAPFAHRTFTKPLGYAGDYEMVNMMLRQAHEGGSLFAKLVNTWFLRQAPAEAHRNRIQYLVDKLLAETLRVTAAGRDLRVFNVACGPAHEVHKFLLDHALSSHCAFTLLDFNEETIRFTDSQLQDTIHRHGRNTRLKFEKRSVQSILKESARTVVRAAQDQYDVVYCAGLFDYLSDPICHRLLSIMHDWLAPGGLLLATNVDPSNPMRKGMEHLLDWHLIYRNAAHMIKLKPRQATDDSVFVCSDFTGVNVFLEVRKPVNG
jgi:extracellular factor (EF) 3-hydroxypalmitic acid methyl ester biosynthesis protein